MLVLLVRLVVLVLKNSRFCGWICLFLCLVNVSESGWVGMGCGRNDLIRNRFGVIFLLGMWWFCVLVWGRVVGVVLCVCRLSR